MPSQHAYGQPRLYCRNLSTHNHEKFNSGSNMSQRKSPLNIQKHLFLSINLFKTKKCFIVNIHLDFPKHFIHHITKILTVQENKDLYEQFRYHQCKLKCQWNISVKCQHSAAVLGQLGKTIRKSTSHAWGTQWRSWFRHCATSQTVAGSIPNGVTGIFHHLNPSSHITCLGHTVAQLV